MDYLVMEFLEGETLAARLAKSPLAPDQVSKYGIEICEGLEKAHKTRVIHRDLEPGNIMLTKAGTKLMDFGLAKAVTGPPPSSGLTATLDGTWAGAAAALSGEWPRAASSTLSTPVLSFSTSRHSRRPCPVVLRGHSFAVNSFRMLRCHRGLRHVIRIVDNFF
jgi:serine/threonine protein kinase